MLGRAVGGEGVAGGRAKRLEDSGGKHFPRGGPGKPEKGASAQEIETRLVAVLGLRR